MANKEDIPRILQQPIRDRKRPTKSVAVSGLLPPTEDSTILRQIEERWLTLGSHFGLDFAKPGAWKRLAECLLDFDLIEFQASNEHWKELAQKLARDRFSGFKIDKPPESGKWTIRRLRTVYQIVERERYYLPTGERRVSAKRISTATEHIAARRKRRNPGSMFCTASTLRRIYYRACEHMEQERLLTSYKIAVFQNQA